MLQYCSITFSNLYDGEVHDDTLEEMPIESVRFCGVPESDLTERMSLPVTVHETFDAVELIHTLAGEILQHGNFYNESLRSTMSEYVYISDGGEHLLILHFTYYGYRYAKVEGVSDLKKEDFKGISLYSDIQQTGVIETGHELVNRLIQNVHWGLKSDFIDVLTDCP